MVSGAVGNCRLVFSLQLPRGMLLSKLPVRRSVPTVRTGWNHTLLPGTSSSSARPMAPFSCCCRRCRPRMELAFVVDFGMENGSLVLLLLLLLLLLLMLADS